MVIKNAGHHRPAFFIEYTWPPGASSSTRKLLSVTTVISSLKKYRPVIAIMLIVMASQLAYGQAKDGSYTEQEALEISQAAIGRELAALEFTDSSGQPVSLADFKGQPLLISLIFTSCHHVCPALTRHLKTAVDSARDALGHNSFSIVTIGFDTPNDTPERMQNFARKQGIDDPRWAFLSGSAETMASLVENVGFIYFPTARGFDHITQVTITDREGVIYQQVYGGTFELPWLVEPLKDLILNRPQSRHNFLSAVVDRVKLFCTVYDPNTGRYRFDYSLFVQIAIGALVVLGTITYLLVEIRRARRRKKKA
jgi:protein SCO1/2